MYNPKTLYPSSATTWSNDAYTDRISFPEEHEEHHSSTENSNDLPREQTSLLILAKDSSKQLLLFNMFDDFAKCIKGE